MTLHGCHNKPREGKPLLVQDGWITGMNYAGSPIRLPRMVEIQFINSIECRHDKRLTDTGCTDCQHAK